MDCRRCGFCCIWFEVRQHKNPKNQMCPHLQFRRGVAICLFYDNPDRYQGCIDFNCEDVECQELFSRWTDFYEQRDEWRAKRNWDYQILEH